MQLSILFGGFELEFESRTSRKLCMHILSFGAHHFVGKKSKILRCCDMFYFLFEVVLHSSLCFECFPLSDLLSCTYLAQSLPAILKWSKLTLTAMMHIVWCCV